MPTPHLAYGAPTPMGHFVHAMQAGRFLYVSGQGPIDPRTGDMPVGISAQTTATFQNLDANLRACGSNLQNNVRVSVYMRRPEDSQAFNDAYAKAFGQHGPARTTTCPGLLDDILIEIDCAAEV